jgi:plastocyanin
MLVVGMALIGLPACGGGTDGARTILTDFNYDRFGTSINGYFPRVTEVHPGQKVVFKQAWTGEAHTVSLGALTQPVADIVGPYLRGEKEPPPEGAPPGLDEAAGALPSLFGEDDANQTAAQPCFLRSGSLPSDGRPCRRVAQPRFTGREAFYSSGFIPYEGNSGNQFTMQLSDDIKPGDYYYFCLLHGPGMGGFLRVKSRGTPSQGAVNRQARRELDTVTKELTSAYDDARAKKWDVPPGSPRVDILAGAATRSITFALVNEFFPKTYTATVNEPVTWLIFGHTVSFKVPKYGPQLRVDSKTHAVNVNKQAYNPVGISIPTSGDPDAPAPPFDAGTYDGSRFLSSGVQFGLVYTITFTKAGTYPYACTIHPRMVGTLVVKA